MISLNSHFDHYRFFPNDPNDVLATEITGTTPYTGSLVYSVGCHSGLNVYDGSAPPVLTGTDFAQAFTRQGATFVGNTGFGYGDSDLVSYSELLALNFTQELGYNPTGAPATLPTVGLAMMRAKQRYLNSFGNGALTTYDEKVMAEMTVYGLPMLKVNMPTQSTEPPGGAPQAAPSGRLQEAASGSASKDMVAQAPQVTTATTYTLPFVYTPHAVAHRFATARITRSMAEPICISPAPGRFCLAAASASNSTTDMAHGVLMVGGDFNDTLNFDPLVSNIISQEMTLDTEGVFPIPRLYPTTPAFINRFLVRGGTVRQRLVVVPAQFQATNTIAPTLGTLRRYDNLDLVVYSASLNETDFIAPNIWAVQALTTPVSIEFKVTLDDDSGAIQRTVVLYRTLDQSAWSRVELPYDPATGTASKIIEPIDGTVEYFVQAVDPAGNVALALDHGVPFRVTATLPPGQARVTLLPNSAGTLTYTDGNGNPTQVIAPGGAVPATTTLLYTSLPSATGGGQQLLFAGHAFTLNGYRSGVFFPDSPSRRLSRSVSLTAMPTSPA